MTPVQELLSEYLKDPQKYATEIQIIANSVKTVQQLTKLEDEVIKGAKIFSKDMQVEDVNITKKRLVNTDFDYIPKLMRRVDEIYGRAENYIYTKGLVEEFDSHPKKNKV